ncbi:TPM domain-containing protein [Empedobacter brevis]|uniref:TPM domain-containing protein n=1 Tax=Empedobacter brevis TaxID=247 RepID=UPI0023F05469|nr:TPM domain-containing protein [Empedobacter brevis]
MKKFFPIFIIVILFIFGCKTIQNETQKTDPQKTLIKNEFPKPLGYVSDYEKVLTNEELNKLSKILAEYENTTTNQIAIISISKNLNENNFNQYALDLSNNWGIGTAEKNNGLTIVFSKHLRKIRICTGTGTEKILTDQICEKVLNEKILPEFKNDDYYSGLINGINEFIKLWK